MRWYRVEITYAYDGEPYGGEIHDRLLDAVEAIVSEMDDSGAERTWWASGDDVTEEVERIPADEAQYDERD